MMYLVVLQPWEVLMGDSSKEAGKVPKGKHPGSEIDGNWRNGSSKKICFKKFLKLMMKIGEHWIFIRNWTTNVVLDEKYEFYLEWMTLL